MNEKRFNSNDAGYRKTQFEKWIEEKKIILARVKNEAHKKNVQRELNNLLKMYDAEFNPKGAELNEV